jgi:hypothetical protein
MPCWEGVGVALAQGLHTAEVIIRIPYHSCVGGATGARLAWRPGASPPSASLASSISPNVGPGVEADQLPAFDHNAPISHPEQYPVCVGERAVGVAHPDALSNPGPGISFSDIAASLRGRQLRLQHSEASAPQYLSGWLVIVLAHRLILP